MDKVVDVLVVQVLGCREESVEIPQLLLVVAWTTLLTCPLFIRALCTGTGPGFDPATRAEKGWRGSWES